MSEVIDTEYELWDKPRLAFKLGDTGGPDGDGSGCVVALGGKNDRGPWLDGILEGFERAPNWPFSATDKEGGLPVLLEGSEESIWGLGGTKAGRPVCFAATVIIGDDTLRG